MRRSGGGPPLATHVRALAAGASQGGLTVRGRAAFIGNGAKSQVGSLQYRTPIDADEPQT
jgi:hypothetical protein